MIIETISEVAPLVAALSGDIQAAEFGDVCARAPSAEADSWARRLVGWVKWGVIWILIGCGFASAALMVIGKFAQMGKAAQIGAAGMGWTVLGAIAFAVIYGILSVIVGNGC